LKLPHILFLLSNIKMFIIPRTPASPTRNNHTMPKPTLYISSPSESSISLSSQTSSTTKDIYDMFIDIYFQSDIKVRYVLLKKIIDHVGHPVYAHLLNTMDKENSHHVMGYLRSQKSFEMYNILLNIIINPLPTKYEFYNLLSK
jgi:hypothetical protein